MVASKASATIEPLPLPHLNGRLPGENKLTVHGRLCYLAGSRLCKAISLQYAHWRQALSKDKDLPRQAPREPPGVGVFVSG